MPTINNVHLTIEKNHTGSVTAPDPYWDAVVEFDVQFTAEEVAARTTFETRIELRASDRGEAISGLTSVLWLPPLFTFPPPPLRLPPRTLITADAADKHLRYHSHVPYDALDEDPGTDTVTVLAGTGRDVHLEEREWERQDEVFAIVRMRTAAEALGVSNIKVLGPPRPPSTHPPIG